MKSYRFKEPLKKPKLLTIQGQARGGKGTLVRALREEFEKQYRVYSIDQGLKFRIFAKMALIDEINYEDILLLSRYVTDDSKKAEVLKRLSAAAHMSKDELEAEYYTHHKSNVSGMFGKVSETHDVVVDILLDEVRAAAGSYDIILIDGRSMQTYGDILQKAGVVDFVLAVDVVCEPLTAARRVTQIFEAVEDLGNNELISLIKTTEDISRRNSSDARRERDPSVYLHGAYEFDVLHPPVSDEEFAAVAKQVARIGAVSIDNSYTRTPEQLTVPSTKLISLVVEQSLPQ